MSRLQTKMDQEISHLKETTTRIEGYLDKVQQTQVTTDVKLRLMLVRLGVEEPNPDNMQEVALARATGIAIPGAVTPRTPRDKRKTMTNSDEVGARYLICGPREPPLHGEDWSYTRVKLVKNIADHLWELHQIEPDGHEIGKTFKPKAPILAKTEEEADYLLAERISGKC